MNGQQETAIRSRSQPRGPWRPAPAVVAIVIVTCCVEFLLQASDLGLTGNTRLRGFAYENGAFWVGLLDNWRPNYPAQPWLMFLSYQVLHTGLSHLLGNMFVLLIVGHIVVRRVGQTWFAAIYVISGIGGAIGFALLSDSAQPMVGASGALFGLVGAWKWQDWFFNAQNGVGGKSLVMDIIGLILLNILLWVVQGGQVAWETHLGGFLTGWLAATLVIPREEESAR
ncbi:rhomboid family intramembrane serine protease [Microbulbifer sp. S227A]|uniref:rhomboid family intramembrane serine protease n=1 Tax=Microbulbifer sp. S227A TaxID=3415131 RepID=UPI003C7A0CCF